MNRFLHYPAKHDVFETKAECLRSGGNGNAGRLGNLVDRRPDGVRRAGIDYRCVQTHMDTARNRPEDFGGSFFHLAVRRSVGRKPLTPEKGYALS
jgi:hypothetical protein